MTSRRANPTLARKISRALQFIPGHLSGRVASAQPVIRRKGIGTVGMPATPPPPA